MIEIVYFLLLLRNLLFEASELTALLLDELLLLTTNLFRPFKRLEQLLVVDFYALILRMQLITFG